MRTRGEIHWLGALACAALLACSPSEPAPASQASGGETPAPAQPAAAESTPQASPVAEAPPPSAASEAAPATSEAAPAVGAAAAVTAAAPAAPAVAVTPPSAAATSAAAAPVASDAAAPAAGARPTATQPKPALQPSAAATKPASSAPTPAVAAQPAAAGPPAANTPGRVVVDLVGLKSDAGQVLAALFRSSAGFPEEPQRAQQRKTVKIRGRRVELAFEGVPPGPFAVSLFHDEDANAKMKTGMFGIPSEGYGFTRDAKGSFGPPDFEDARLQLAAGETKKVTIHLNY